MKTYTIRQIRKLLDPDETDYMTFERESVNVVEFLLGKTDNLVEDFIPYLYRELLDIHRVLFKDHISYSGQVKHGWDCDLCGAITAGVVQDLSHYTDCPLDKLQKLIERIENEYLSQSS